MTQKLINGFELIRIGEGMMSEAYLYNENFVLLVGKRSDSFENYEKLKNNLDMLEGKIKSLEIPNGVNLIQPCDDYPLGALSFSYVKGTELKKQIHTCTMEQKIAIGKSLATFIFEMQNTDIMLDKSKEIEITNSKLKRSSLLIQPYLSKDESKKLQQVAIKYDELMKKSKFVMTHGDLQEENLLVDEENNLVGVIDFGNMEYYVAEIEFAPMMKYDTVIFDSMIKNYKGKIDVNDIKLINLVWQVRFFKHVINWSLDAMNKKIENIRLLLNDYVS